MEEVHADTQAGVRHGGKGEKEDTLQLTVRLTVVRLGPHGHTGFTLLIYFDGRWSLFMMFIF